MPDGAGVRVPRCTFPSLLPSHAGLHCPAPQSPLPYQSRHLFFIDRSLFLPLSACGALSTPLLAPTPSPVWSPPLPTRPQVRPEALFLSMNAQEIMQALRQRQVLLHGLGADVSIF